MNESFYFHMNGAEVLQHMKRIIIGEINDKSRKHIQYLGRAATTKLLSCFVIYVIISDVIVIQTQANEGRFFLPFICACEHF